MRTPILFQYEIDRIAAEADPSDLLLSNLDLATKMASWFNRHRPSNLPLEELQAEALLALVELVHEDSFDTSRDFRKYAGEVIKCRLGAAVKNSKGIRIDHHKRKEARALKDLEGAKEMTDKEICEAMGWSERKLRTARQALAAMSEHNSLDQKLPSEHSTMTLGDSIPDPELGPENAVLTHMEALETKERVKQIVSELPPGMRIAISFRFGIPVPEVQTIALRDIIRVIDNSSAIDRGLKKLRKEHGDDGLVSSHRGSTVDGRTAHKSAAGEAGKSLALEKWRYYRDGPEGPPVLQSTGTVGN